MDRRSSNILASLDIQTMNELDESGDSKIK
jgi:hypothetical protein